MSTSPPESGLDALDPTLRAILDRMPAEPGVYLMKDKKGKVIYIGKARNLRARVRSYFTRSSSDYRAFVALLDRLLGDIETVVVNNEKEALLLENNLIKQHQPRFNVKLVDDKNYLVLRLDPRARYPRLEVTRRIGSDGARYFGPYHSATSCRQTLHVVNRHFKLRTCSDQVLASRKRPCLQYQIKRCDAPCVYPVAEEEYAEQVRDVALFLDGKDQELVERLRGRMKEASRRLEFEVAASVRDQITSLEKTLTEQRVVLGDLRDQDVFGLHREGSSIELAVLHIRAGKLLGRRTFHFTGQEFPDEETVSSFVSLYYDLGSFIPDEVLLPCSIEDAETKAEWLRERRAAAPQGERASRGRAVTVLHPQRGPRARLVELANKNAQAAWASQRDKTEDVEAALARLKERLGLKRVPRRIECYDISHIQGTSTVASMVVFIDGEPARSEYRKFKVRQAANDDFAAMYEVLSRRFRRAGGPADDAARWRPPDLVVVDGGKGQLGVALAALRDARVDLGPSGLDVIGLAKERASDASAADTLAAPLPGSVAGATQPPHAALQQKIDAAAHQTTDAATQHEATATPTLVPDTTTTDPAAAPAPSDAAPAARKARWRRGRGSSESDDRRPDRVFLPRIKDPIPLRPNTAEMHVLSRIRDEAHRFAITFHRSLRTRRTLRSALADIPGVGATRQRELLRHFGSLKGVREATVDQLAAVSGMTRSAAEAVHAFLRTAASAPAAGERDPEAAYAALQHPPRPARPRAAAAEEVAEDAAAEELLALTANSSPLDGDVDVSVDVDESVDGDVAVAVAVADEHSAPPRRPPPHGRKK